MHTSIMVFQAHFNESMGGSLDVVFAVACPCVKTDTRMPVPQKSYPDACSQLVQHGCRLLIGKLPRDLLTELGYHARFLVLDAAAPKANAANKFCMIGPTLLQKSRQKVVEGTLPARADDTCGWAPIYAVTQEPVTNNDDGLEFGKLTIDFNEFDLTRQEQQALQEKKQKHGTP